MRESTDRLLSIQAVVDMHDKGDLTAEQAMAAIGIESGRHQRSAQSEALGDLIHKVMAGAAPVSALTAWLNPDE